MDDFELIERRMDAVEKLAEITPRYREAFLLHEYGFTQEQIGEIMGVTQQTISRYIARALKELTKAGCVKAPTS